jgi:CheY-like chemotaxis protein
MGGSGQGVEVLVAEDNAINQAVLTGLLAIAFPQFRCTIVEDGARAVAAWRDGAFALVFMDVRMPGMDGREATVAIRAEEAASGRRRTPIIALTGESSAADVAACLAAGMDAHVAKPIAFDHLTAAVRSALQEA